MIGKRGEKLIRRLFVEEDGQTLVEYGLLVSLIAVVAIAILAVLGRKARDVFVQVNTRMTSTG
jgi:pilus assembly protein Flp/PilA